MYLTWDDVRPYIEHTTGVIMASVRQKITERFAQFYLYTIIKRASDGTNNQNPLIDIVEGQATGGNQPGGQVPAPAQCPARRIEFPGFAFVPMVNDPSLLSGFAANLVHFALASARWRPVGLKQGETCQYNLAETQSTIKISQSGLVDIDTTTSGGKGSPPSQQADVVVNQGVHAVAREGDPVGWMLITAATVSGVTVVTNTGWTATDPILSPPPPILVAGSYAVPLRITGGAPHFKG